jgi:hypothetical protein
VPYVSILWYPFYIRQQYKQALTNIQKDTMVKVKFVARLGKMGEEKIHVLVPKEHWNTLKPLVRKQVRVTIDDEL